MKKNNFFSNKIFFIAEAGSNFNQNFATAKKLVDLAKNAGADLIKFQLFDPIKLYPNNPKMFKIFDDIKLTKQMFIKIKKYADKKKIMVSASVFDLDLAKFLNDLEVPLNKIASSELTNLELIDYLSKSKKPIVLSTGMSDLDDIKRAVNICEKNKNYNISILQCGSVYPLSYQDVNLNVLSTFKDTFGYPIGLSDHTLDNLAAISSVGMGATVFEKHFTLSKKMKGPDHFYALEKNELNKYINDIKKSYLCLGDKKKDLLKYEKKHSRREGLYFKDQLKKGTILKSKHLYAKRPALGIRPKYLKNIIGRKLKRNAKKNEPLINNFLYA